MATLTEKFAPLLNWLKVQVGENARDGEKSLVLALKDLPKLTARQLLFLTGL